MGKIIHDKPQGTAFRLAGMPDWQARATAAEAKVAVLEEALGWYQDQVSKCNRLTDTTARNALARDLGKRAAAALKGSTNG